MYSPAPRICQACIYNRTEACLKILLYSCSLSLYINRFPSVTSVVFTPHYCLLIVRRCTYRFHTQRLQLTAGRAAAVRCECDQSSEHNAASCGATTTSIVLAEERAVAGTVLTSHHHRHRHQSAKTAAPTDARIIVTTTG